MSSRRSKSNATTETKPPAKPATLRSAPLPPGDDAGAAELTRQVAENLKAKRKSRDLSLDQLAQASGVSRAALSQIEAQKTNPSLGVLWKIAVGLGIPFAELIGGRARAVTVMRRAETQALRSANGHLESRALTPAGTSPWVEVYELCLKARAAHSSEAHAPGTHELLIVLSGKLRLHVGADAFDLAAGDSVSFRADRPHTYDNPGNSEARYHDIIIYTH